MRRHYKKSCYKKLGYKKLWSSRGLIFSTLLLAPLLLTACNSATDAPLVVSNQNGELQALVTEPNLEVNNSQASPSADLLESQEIIAPSFTDNDSSAIYIAPEELSKSLNSPVNDFTSTLSAAELAYLNEKALQIDKEGLLQLGIVVVATTEEMPIFDYAMTVAKNWALGSPENNNGLLILMALNDRQIYILTGLDIEDKLTDERVAGIIKKDITPHFRHANYATGLSAGMDALVQDMRQ